MPGRQCWALPAHSSLCQHGGLVANAAQLPFSETASAQPAHNVICGLGQCAESLLHSSSSTGSMVRHMDKPLHGGQADCSLACQHTETCSSHRLRGPCAAWEWNATCGRPCNEDQKKRKAHPAAAAPSAGHAKAGAKAGAPVEASLIAGRTNIGRCHLQSNGGGVSGVVLLSAAQPPSSVQGEDKTKGRVTAAA